MNELCILQDDVPPFPNQVKHITEPQLFLLIPFMLRNYNTINHLDIINYDPDVCHNNVLDCLQYHRGGTGPAP